MTVTRPKRRLSPTDIGKILDKIRHRYAAQSMSAHGQDWGDLFRRMDKNHDGTLNFVEVRGMLRRVLKMTKEDISDKQMEVLFEELDWDHTGEITLEELRWLLAEGHVDEIVAHIERKWNNKETPRPAEQGEADFLGLPPDVVEEARELFQLFDEDYSGKLDCEEMVQCLQALGFNPSHADCEHIMASVPPDGADFDTFVRLAFDSSQALHHQDDDSALVQAFKAFDSDNRGWISIAEVRYIMQNYGEPLSEEELEDMVKRLDDDGDGVITFQEAVQGPLFANDPLEELRARRRVR